MDGRADEQKISKPSKGICYPMWMWYQWEGKRKRCDLRCGDYAKRGTPMVQITFEIEPEKCFSRILMNEHGF